MNEDELIDLIFNQGSKFQQSKKESRDREILDKLDEIEKILQYLVKSYSTKNLNHGGSLCEQVLSAGYTILDEDNGKISKNYFVIELDNNRKLIAFVDTIELLNFYFSQSKDEQELEVKLPKRLLPLFRFLKRNGLIYFDYDKKKYVIIDYK